MAYFVADEKLQGYYVSDGVTINIVKYHFECDDAASLPAQTAFITSKKVKISMASTAHTIDADALYKMDSSGAWVQQSQPWQPLADYSVLSNKPQINGHTLTGNQSGADFGLQNVLTFDANPTQNSTNPVTSGGIWADQQRQETEIGVVANAGAKNLLNPDDYKKNSTGGLTITETGTGTYKITGTPSGTVDVFTTQSGTFDRMYGLEAGKTYTISGLPTGNGLLCRIDMSKNNSGSWDAQIISNLTLPQTFTVPSDATGLYIRYRVTTSATIPSGGISLEPMIRPAAITDPTFQPYARTNRELTVLTDEDRAALVELVDGGAKNLMKLGFTHKSAGFQTADMTADGNGIIVNGDRNGTTDTILVYDLVTNQSNMLDTRYTLPAGKYVIPSTGTSDLRYQVYCHDGTNYQSLGYTMINPLEFEYTLALKAQYPYIAYRLWASRVSSFDNFTTYPMVCTKAAWDISQTFQPYRPSWQEMYDMILALQ